MCAHNVHNSALLVGLLRSEHCAKNWFCRRIGKDKPVARLAPGGKLLAWCNAFSCLSLLVITEPLQTVTDVDDFSCSILLLDATNFGRLAP